MPKKLAARTLTIATGGGGGKENEKGKEADNNKPSLKLLTRQLSIMEGGSCPNSPQVKKACRLVVLGSTQTGKTCIVNRFLNGTYDDCYVPTIENFHRKLYRIHGEFYQLDILDTSGNDPFPAARRLSLLTGDLFLLVFSVDKAGSYDEILRLREQIVEAKSPMDGGPSWMVDSSKRTSTLPSSSSSTSYCRVPIAIAANKIDLKKSKHALDLDEIRTILMALPNCVYVECSAKTCQNVNEVFGKLFALAKLPKQMAPGQHRQVSLEKSVDSAVSSSSAPVDGADASRRSSRTASLRATVVRLRQKHNEPAVAFDAEARRPSLRTDLMLLRAKQSSSQFFAGLAAPAASTVSSASSVNSTDARSRSRRTKAKRCNIQ